MSTRGRGRSRVGKVRPLPTAITASQPPVSTSPAADPVNSQASDAAHSSAGDRTSSIETSPVIRNTEGRIVISISAARQFVAGRPTINILKKCFDFGGLFESRLLPFFPTFQHVAEEVKDFWWEDFKTSFAWPAHTDEEVRLVFDRACGIYYPGFMNSIKELVWQAEEPKPAFLTDEAWAQWIAHWEDHLSRERSELGKRSNASSSGSGTKRRTGSINRREHHRHVGDYERIQDAAVAEVRLERTNGFVEHGAGKLNLASDHSSASSARYPPQPIMDMSAVTTQLNEMKQMIKELQVGRIRDLKEIVGHGKNIQDIMETSIGHGKMIQNIMETCVGHGKMIVQNNAQLLEMGQLLLTHRNAPEQQQHHHKGQGQGQG